MENELSRLKVASSRYFEILGIALQSIRSNEKSLYGKIGDLFATSIDFEPNADAAKKFFVALENKFHWAMDDHTSAQPQVHLVECSSVQCNTQKSETAIHDHLKLDDSPLLDHSVEQLNRIVATYLDFAELQAHYRKPMQMQDWAAKLHGLLVLNDHDLPVYEARPKLDNLGSAACHQNQLWHDQKCQLLLPAASEHGRAPNRQQRRACA